MKRLQLLTVVLASLLEVEPVAAGCATIVRLSSVPTTTTSRMGCAPMNRVDVSVVQCKGIPTVAVLLKKMILLFLTF